jgi:ubiquinone/menaquinone biosynthesis C-methylase UbiE
MDRAAFWNGIAARYAARPLDAPQAWETTLERCRAYLKPDWHVLEIGAGTGSTALRLAEYVAAYRATDFANALLDVAKERAARDPKPGLVFEECDAMTALRAHRVDAVLAFSVLHLLENRVEHLSAVRAALAPGGLFISKTPSLGGRYWLCPVVRGMQVLGKAPPGIAFLRPRDVEAEIAAAGFEVLETGDYPPSLPNHFVVARAV